MNVDWKLRMKIGKSITEVRNTIGWIATDDDFDYLTLSMLACLCWMTSRWKGKADWLNLVRVASNLLLQPPPFVLEDGRALEELERRFDRYWGGRAPWSSGYSAQLWRQSSWVSNPSHGEVVFLLALPNPAIQRTISKIVILRNVKTLLS